MALNSITQTPITIGIPETWRGPRTTGSARTGRMTIAWPWPLPINSVLAVFDDAATLPAVVASLRRAGIADDRIWTVAGENGTSALRATFTERGAFARLRSLLDDEDEIVGQLIERIARGGTAVLVQPQRDGVDTAAAVVRSHGAQLLRRTGRWISVWEGRGA